MVNIAVLGYGTIGSGVFKVLRRNQEIIDKKAGEEIRIKYVLDLREFPNDPVEKILTHDFQTILNDDDVKVVVEVMGGTGAAYKFVKEALLKGKHVATSNKALVAAYGPELLQIAREKNVNFLFEASVGGGIPIIRTFNHALTADNILEITGILNGTTNYILTEMTQKGASFDEVLKEAQKLGYAEADPTADVEGYDACRKIAILSSLAFGKTANFKEIYTEGITKITNRDIAYAKKMHSVIKLIGTSKNLPEGISAMVAPVILSTSHPLAMVHGAFNAIFVKGNVLGDTMYYGKGAGSLPTASAVVADVVDIVRHIDENIPVDWTQEKLPILNMKDVPVRALVRISAKNLEGAKVLAQDYFEQSQIIQLEDAADEFGLITAKETEAGLKEKIEQLGKGAEIRNVIRLQVSL